ncbi:regulator of chromosome condensation [Chloropicon primus]|uniref:Regulator of chromosome condensation n=1 Tax=Chloropicon primus TaxID=1764295 RepID=A0A5B8ME76_9CHLO|nr:regulator of chromosome condensation [Chloropicon primus]UPQ96866.1 regulator of chromosome condensation [Chloropicon primus]|eukprot:QDZ17650.1 regulator of chromosome condensation [Chloropicon primus]
MEDKRAEAKGHLRALNEQFASYIQGQSRTNATGIWASACKDYIMHLNELEREYGTGLVAANGSSEVGGASGGSQIFMFGTGDCGQLGFGEDVPELPFPKALSWKGLTFQKLVCGGMHTVALSSDGTVWSWGVNDEGALGRLAKSNNDFVDAKAMGLGGSADAIPENVPGKVDLPAGSRVAALSAGDSHCMALLTSGEVWGWGSYRNSSGVLGFSEQTKIQRLPTKVDIPITSGKIVEIASGADHVLGLSDKGEVFSWGCSEKGRLGRLDKTTADKSPKEDATVKAKSLGVGRVTSLSDVKHVACGFFSSFALRKDGTAFGWGLNNYGQLSLPDEGPFYEPQRLESLSRHGIKCISGGEHHTLALTQKGKVLAFGRPTYGRLGRADVSAGEDAFVSEPNFAEGISGRVESIGTGMAVSGAVTVEGDAYVWGYGTTGQLGKGEDEEDEVLPYLLKTKRLAKADVQMISFGGQHSGLVAKPKATSEEPAQQNRKRVRL